MTDLLEQIGRSYRAACSLAQERQTMRAEMAGILGTICLLLAYESWHDMRRNEGVDREVSLYDLPADIAAEIKAEEAEGEYVSAVVRDRPGHIVRMLPTEFMIAFNRGDAKEADEAVVEARDRYLEAIARLDRDLQRFTLAALPLSSRRRA